MSPEAPSAASSTDADDEKVCEPLTPRSKIKAMLADLEDDSDDDNASQKVDASRHQLRNHTLPIESDDGDFDDGAVVRPRGGLAARLQAGNTREGGSESESEADGKSAYQRIRQQLLRKTSPPAGDPPAASNPTSSPAPAPLKRRLFTKKRAVEVLPQVQSSQDSADLDSSTRCANDKTSAPSPRASSRREFSETRSSPVSTITPSKPRTDPTVLSGSPGLFVSPHHSARQSRAHSTPRHDSDSDSLEAVSKRNRFLELVARRRAENEAKEASKVALEDSDSEAESRGQLPTKERSENQTVAPEDSTSAESDHESTRRLTQLSKPRKASKKALVELNRETQRMSRNLQLAHQLKTKRKITKDSLLAKFGFSVLPTPPRTQQPASSSPTAPPAPLFDTEPSGHHQTPGTSPVTPKESFKEPINAVLAAMDTEESYAERYANSDDDLPNFDELWAQAKAPLDKGKGKAVEEVLLDDEEENSAFSQRHIKVIPPSRPAHISGSRSSSDDELEIVPSATATSLSVFDRIKPQDEDTRARPMRTLRALANLASPRKATIKAKSSMTASEMQLSLQQKARQQAAMEREEKLQNLRRRGIIVQTAEEKEREQVEVENLLEKARKDAERIKQHEKRNRQRNGELGDSDALADDSDEDADYDGSVVEDDMSIELSGSEEESADDEHENEEDAVEESTTAVVNAQDSPAFADVEAEIAKSEAAEEHAAAAADAASDDDLSAIPLPRPYRRKRATRILDDEDAADGESLETAPQASVNASTVIVPHLPGSDEAPMGLTQAFAVSLGDNDSQLLGTASNELDHAAIAMSPQGIPKATGNEIPDEVVPNSQRETPGFGEYKIDLGTTPSKGQHPVLLLATQDSELPDPSQDVGFGAPPPLHDRFVSIPPSTIDTVLLRHKSASPPIKKRGRLHKRARVTDVFSDEETAARSDGDDELLNDGDAFTMLKRASKAAEKRNAFNKKKSNAKEMVEDQAAESEDEYAGLGGASGDESNSEEDDEVRGMIDESDVDVDERELAAFYAGKERASDEKAVEKLYRDINNGTLRKKRGAAFDLSDSEDDTAARQRRKRREFAKMRKALLSNEKLEKIADDPKKQAFLHAIEDHDDDDDIDFLDHPEDDSQGPLHLSADSQSILDSQPQQQPQQQQPEDPSHKRKRPLEESLPSIANRPPPAARRSLKTKRPSSLAEIRQSLSFLIDEPNAAERSHLFHADDATSEVSGDENGDDGGISYGFRDDMMSAACEPSAAAVAHRRRSANPIIDRLSLKRAATTGTATTTTSTGGRLAFQAPATNNSTGSFFKVPSLLRRATIAATALQTSNTHGITHGVDTTTNTATQIKAAAGTERTAGGGEKADFVMRTSGTKRSSVNYCARESTKAQGVRLVEARREMGRRKMVGAERRAVLGGLGAGRFD